MYDGGMTQHMITVFTAQPTRKELDRMAVSAVRTVGHLHQPPQRSNSARGDRLSTFLLDSLILASGFLIFVQIPIIGQLHLTEVLLVFTFFLLVPQRGRLLKRDLPFKFIFLFLIWLLAQVITDMVRGSTFSDYSRGWATIGFSLINFCALYMALTRRPKRLFLFLVGLSTGQITGYFLAPSEYAIAYPWKFGFGMGVTWMVVLVAVRLSRKKSLGHLGPAIVLIIIASVNILMGFRSMGGISFLVACFLIAQSLGKSRAATKRRPLRRIALLGVLIVVGSSVLALTYEYSVRHGWLGESAREKYEMQAEGQYGLLLGGRSEIMVSSLAVLDSPVIGHGSWAKNCHYASLYTELKEQAGYFPGEEKHQCLIPAHSHLMGSWVQAGFIGAVVWLWVIVLIVRALLVTYSTRNELSPLIAFCAFALTWDILFSPFSGFMRLITPFYIVVIMTSITGEDRPRTFKTFRLRYPLSYSNFSRR